MSKYRINISVLLMAVVALIVPMTVHAFSPDVYASQSVLSSGRWIKVSVPSTGVYCISQATLRKWGFSNPSAVRVYGYGGARIKDYLTMDSYVDDLPQVATELSQRGLVFYAVGPDKSEFYGRSNKYRVMNPFSSVGYYYLTDNAGTDALSVPVADVAPDAASGHQTTYQAVVTHERDLTSPGETGHLFVGEDFMYTRSQTFSFDVPDRVD
ncbi:MAG: hypothetical protein K2M76_05765, partial [Muribaculaceae bacterium]|nr:hypothetical protein [Muribaculaceae bacterium]